MLLNVAKNTNYISYHNADAQQNSHATNASKDYKVHQ